MNVTAEMRTLLAKIGARDRTIARLEAELKDKRDALALEIMAHEKTVEALRAAQGGLVSRMAHDAVGRYELDREAGLP